MCGIVGIISADGRMIDGGPIAEAIAIQRERGNGLGGGFAVYGCYEEHKEDYAFHVMYEGDRNSAAIAVAEDYLKKRMRITRSEEIPVYPSDRVPRGPYFKRYFLRPIEEFLSPDQSEQNYILETVMTLNMMTDVFVVSSGKNMGVFKGMGYPEDIADYFRIEDYRGYMWTAHNRFPTNTPGWWGGAHPFTILDKAVVHNGEITSYGTNRRWLEMHGYYCLLRTDTEVIAYIYDKLTRQDNLPKEAACTVMAPALWDDIDRRNDDTQRVFRQIYASAIVNGPFGIVITHSKGAIILNDRNKLRPLVCAWAGSTCYASSEECSIRLLSPKVDEIWSPRGGEPVFVDIPVH